VVINVDGTSQITSTTIPSTPKTKSTATSRISIPCQNALDATIAGTAVAHQLLTASLQMTPSADVSLNTDIGNAKSAVIRAYAFVGALATSVSGNELPPLNDLHPMNSALSSALISVNLAIRNLRDAQMMNSSNHGSSVKATAQIALISINGPEVLSQPK
jgi:hypothetical protein